MHFKTTRIQYLDALRGIGIVLVVWMHMCLTLLIENKYINITCIFASATCIPILITVSGLLFDNTLKRNEPFLSILKKQFKALIVPFYTLSVIFLFFLIAYTALTGNVHKDWRVALTSLATLNIDESLPSGVLWYLFALFTSSMLLYTLHNILKMNIFTILLISLLMLIFRYYTHGISYFGLERLCQVFFFFCFGCAFSKRIMSISISTIPICTLMILATFSAYLYIVFASENFPLQRTLLHLPMAIFAVAFFLYILKYFEEHNKYVKIIHLFAFLGQKSMAIFIFHMPASRIVIKIGDKFGENEILHLIFTFLMVIIIPLFIERIIAKNTFIYACLLGKKPQ